MLDVLGRVIDNLFEAHVRRVEGCQVGGHVVLPGLVGDQLVELAS